MPINDITFHRGDQPSGQPGVGPVNANPGDVAKARPDDRDVGYAPFYTLNSNNKIVDGGFSIDDKGNSAWPTKGDLVTAIRSTPRIMEVPYHWSDARQKYDQPSGYMLKFDQLQKAVVGDTMFISYDCWHPEIKYLIVSFEKIISGPEDKKSNFTPVYVLDDVPGYVKLGVLDENKSEFKDPNFKNVSSSDELLPRPNQVLEVIKDNVALQRLTSDHTRAKDVAQHSILRIPKGAKITVAGDLIVTSSAEDGTSIWAPVKEISALSAAQ